MLRGDYLRREYPDVILPMVVIRRLDLAMAATRGTVRQAYEKYKGKLENLHGVLTAAAGGSLGYQFKPGHNEQPPRHQDSKVKLGACVLWWWMLRLSHCKLLPIRRIGGLASGGKWLAHWDRKRWCLPG